MIIKSNTQKEKLLEAGKRLRFVLDTVIEKIKPGVTTQALDSDAHALIEKSGDIPAFLGFKPMGAPEKFPATLCTSVNDEIVHGIPNETTVLKEGDIVSVDCGLNHDGFFVDAACTVIVGEGDASAKQLVEATRKALKYALVFVRAGARIGDIGHAVETVANEHELSVPPDLGGHGIGASQHEDPFIPNIGDPDTGAVLEKGLVIAVEPIFTEGEDPRVKLASDKFTYKTADGSRSAHFEHTVIVTQEAPIVVTGSMW